MNKCKHIRNKVISLVTSLVFILPCTMKFPDNSNHTIVASAATDVSNLYATDSSYNFIKAQEGCAYECFWDTAQWSIGYGNKCPYTHTYNGVRGQKGGHTITEEQARQLFDEKISGYVSTLKSNCSGLSMTQNAESGISRVAFPTWTTKKDSKGNDQDDIIWADGIVKDGKASFTVKISDHNNELGYYRTHIYAYDKCGNSDAVAVPDVYIENTKPKISDVKIIEQTSTSYTVQCKVIDNESGIDRVQFPSRTSENDQDDIAKDWGTNQDVRGTIKDNIATFTVNIADHNNETGEYNTHIYAYDKCGNYDSYGVKVNLGVYKLTFDPNGGIYDNTTSAVTKDHILQYGFSYWGNIGEGEYGNAHRNGYILTGYFDKPSGGTKVYDSNGIALNSDYFTNLTYFGNSDLTVYAQWKIIEGDVNADNLVNVADVVLLQKWLLAVPDIRLKNWKAADLCEDDCLNVFDLCLMKRKLIYG